MSCITCYICRNLFLKDCDSPEPRTQKKPTTSHCPPSAPPLLKKEKVQTTQTEVEERRDFWQKESCCTSRLPIWGEFACLEGKGTRKTPLPGTDVTCPNKENTQAAWGGWGSDCVHVGLPIKNIRPEKKHWQAHALH